MKKKTRTGVIIAIEVAVAVLIAAIAIFMGCNVTVNGDLYPRFREELDLTEKPLTAAEIQKLQEKLPDCEILWDVPFQDREIPHDVTEITVQTLAERDIGTLECFPDLETVHAEGCTDYDVLLKLQEARPDLRVDYTLELGTETFAGTARQILLETVTEEDVAKLAYLPRLQKVLCSGGEKEEIALLLEYCQTRGLEFLVSLGGEVIGLDTREVIAGAITDGQLGLLEFLPEMTSLHIRNPEASVENLLALQKARPDVEITWEQELYGMVYPSDAEEMDFSGAKIKDLTDLDEKMTYFPDVETVFLGQCGLDNELLADHREKVRDRYKLVWTVSLGNKLKSRTDAKTFMPVREHVYYFNDEEAYNLRYCEEMVCIDIGHMSIHNIDFVEFMPDLEYLILAHSQLTARS